MLRIFYVINFDVCAKSQFHVCLSIFSYLLNWLVSPVEWWTIKIGLHCLLTDIIEKTFNISPSHIFTVGFTYMFFLIRSKKFSSTSTQLRILITNGLEFCLMLLFCIYWNDHMTCLDTVMISFLSLYSWSKQKLFI